MTALRVEASTSDVGHRRESGPTLRDILQTAAANDTVPPETTSILEIRGDMPCNEEWEILSQHFPAVRYLSVAAGFEERWTDGKFPLNWPLELLVVSDAGAERVATPAILEGRVRNLVLCYTCGLRFEGPSTKELMKDAENIGTIPRRRSDASAASKAGNENDVDKDDGSQNSETKEGDAAAETPSSSEEEEQDGGIKITSVPHEWSKYLNTKYEGKSISFPRDPPPGAPPSQMTSLSVLGNDCLETFTAMAMAHPHLLHGLQSLTLYAASQWDLLHVPTVIFPAALQSLDGLKELKLTLGSAMHARLVPGNGNYLHWMLPPGLEKLSIQGPVSMIPQLNALANAFESAEFLPNLKSISLVLDLPESKDPLENDDGEDEAENKKEKQFAEQLAEAHAACKKVLDVAVAKRGAVVEGHEQPWSELFPALFKKVDKRWLELDGEKKE
ncbi:uncharacterized protein C8A04DRAFT_15167 [Dichotomopilus funicola]|uniref:Uncharacterized protein n=1 Tax=Dichotomopilus funicola TaxID=1934379 RepID=A0AAN6UVV4_9PEZI|nr:hypothetical protein C8A04DRAFT_15167 [Dichotomopilus funicola]